MVAAGVALVRRFSDAALADSALLVWGGTALVALLLLFGLGRCLRSVFRVEGSESRGRLGLGLAVLLAGAVGIYALAGGLGETVGWSELFADDGPAQGQLDESMGRFFNDEYHFSVDVSEVELSGKAASDDQWEYIVRFVYGEHPTAAMFEISVALNASVTNTREWVDFLRERLHSDDGVELVWTKASRLGAYHCARARRRVPADDDRGPHIWVDYEIPGKGRVYLVSCYVPEKDWPVARAAFRRFARSFEYW